MVVRDNGTGQEAVRDNGTGQRYGITVWDNSTGPSVLTLGVSHPLESRVNVKRVALPGCSHCKSTLALTSSPLSALLLLLSLSGATQRAHIFGHKEANPLDGDTCELHANSADEKAYRNQRFRFCFRRFRTVSSSWRRGAARRKRETSSWPRERNGEEDEGGGEKKREDSVCRFYFSCVLDCRPHNIYAYMCRPVQTCNLHLGLLL